MEEGGKEGRMQREKHDKIKHGSQRRVSLKIGSFTDGTVVSRGD